MQTIVRYFPTAGWFEIQSDGSAVKIPTTDPRVKKAKEQGATVWTGTPETPTPKSPAPAATLPAPDEKRLTELDKVLLSMSTELNNLQMDITSIHERMAKPNTQALAAKPAAPAAAPELITPKPAEPPPSPQAEPEKTRKKMRAFLSTQSVKRKLIIAAACAATFFLVFFVLDHLLKETSSQVASNPPADSPPAPAPTSAPPPAPLPEGKKEIEEQPAEVPPPKVVEPKQAAVPEVHRCLPGYDWHPENGGECLN